MISDTLETLRGHLDGTYRVERELGRGGMATVFYAHDLVNDREVAIKVLNPDLSATIGADRFAREIMLASRLDHPHILGLYESGQSDGLLYYVMPFVKGESLRDRIDREGQISVDEAVRIIREVASALDYAHAQSIVHRDIKPENILLLENGHALVADFGIARAATENDAQKLTQTGMAVGTPVYMSPEQSTGEKVGPAADIYSLGCVLYEMLSGEPPFTGKNAMAIMARHAMESVPAIRIIRNSVPEEVEEAIFAAMEKSPVDRPRTCAEFVAILGTPMGETSMRRATRTTTFRRINTPVPEPPTPWYARPAVLVGALLALAGGGAAAWSAFGGSGKATLGDDARRIAVLYFDNDTRDPELAYLSDGVTESVIQSLSGVPVLRVVSRGGAEQFRGSQLPVDSIARALDVGIVVRGNVEKEGDKLRVNVRLVDASGTPLDSKALGPFAGTSLALRDSVAMQVAALIRERLGTEITLREQRDATRNEQAWLLLQRAENSRKRAEASLASRDGEAGARAFETADSLLVQAAKLDGKWPEPFNLRAQMMYRRARLSLNDKDRMRAFVDSGLAYATESLRRSANNPDGLEMRGSLTYLKAIGGLVDNSADADAMVTTAQKDLEQARTVNPLQAGAWATLSHLYNRTGSAEDVNEAAKKALEADAFQADAYNVLDRLFLSSYDLGFTDRASDHCGQMGRRFAGTQKAYRCQLMLMTMPKAKDVDVARAWVLADSAVATSPTAQKPVQQLIHDMYVAAVLVRAGQADSARAVAQRARGDAEVDPTREALLRGAFVYALLSDTTNAVNALKGYLLVNEGQRKAFRDDAGWWFRPIEQAPDFRRLVGATP